ncbi:hypothetical protein [Arthrobacter sp. MMS18-M83]|uniref:hypothetical protein n=1 Tax=Arthrobacter sp. MMS18-M83 TaxID=2996261 RepID=UPI00227A048B|nr:hypothetical protein [Arthrobacter sp. MMS18-M83]WAH97476.1 hypothetical protein OW521_00770 [Arthrobacter sp. MMS18-M83]
MLADAMDPGNGLPTPVRSKLAASADQLLSYHKLCEMVGDSRYADWQALSLKFRAFT